MIHSNKLSIPIKISGTEEKNVETLGLIDSGAGGKFIDQNYAKKAGFRMHKLETPLRAYNVDGTPNKRGTIENYVKLNLEINGRRTLTELYVTGLGRIILGFPWLNEQNSDINWKTGRVSWRESNRRFFFNDKNLHPLELAKKLSRQALKSQQTNVHLRTTIAEEEDEEEYLNST